MFSQNPDDLTRIPPEALVALNAGRKIEAIKLVREATGLGLKEAKDLVERIPSNSEPDATSNPVATHNLTPTVQRGGGGGRVFAVIVLAAALIAIGFWLGTSA